MYSENWQLKNQMNMNIDLDLDLMIVAEFRLLCCSMTFYVEPISMWSILLFTIHYIQRHWNIKVSKKKMSQYIIKMTLNGRHISFFVGMHVPISNHFKAIELRENMP